MNILVTGSSGFLGTALCAWLERQDCAVERLNSRNADLREAGYALGVAQLAACVKQAGHDTQLWHYYSPRQKLEDLAESVREAAPASN